MAISNAPRKQAVLSIMKTNEQRQWICTLCGSTMTLSACDPVSSMIPQPPDGLRCPDCGAGGQMFTLDTGIELCNGDHCDVRDLPPAVQPKAENHTHSRPESKAAKRWYGEVIQNLPEAIVVIDTQGKVRLSNALAENVFQMTNSEMVGMPIDRLIPQCTSYKHFASAEIHRLDGEARQKNGDHLPVEILLKSVDSGELLTAVIRDVTEKNRLQDEQNRLTQQREDYVATLVHDLKTPLLAASRALKLLAAGDFGPITDHQSTFMQTIIDSNQAAYELVGTLLDVYRYDSGIQKLSLSTEDPAQLIQSVERKLAPLALAKGVQLQLSLPHSNMPLQCDAAEIKRVIQNLVDNAIKFTPSGGNVQIQLVQTEGNCEIFVRDNGHGISDGDKPRLFERFWRQSVDRRCHAGTGLGLYLSRKIVELHGGTIVCESTVGVGTTFRFTVPMRAPHEQGVQQDIPKLRSSTVA